jgi:hypothetical protein
MSNKSIHQSKPRLQVTNARDNTLLNILPFALHKIPLSVQALQSRSRLSYISYATTAA